jgi:hypothetical protein
MGFDGGFQNVHTDHIEGSDVNMSTHANREARTFTNQPAHPYGIAWPDDGMHLNNFRGLDGQDCHDVCQDMIVLNLDALQRAADNDWARELVRRQNPSHFYWIRDEAEWRQQNTMLGYYQNFAALCLEYSTDMFYGEC